jgi:hypothetical protein
MTLMDEPLETYLSSIYPPAKDDMTTPVSKTVLQAQPLDDTKAAMGEAFACVLSESEVERTALWTNVSSSSSSCPASSRYPPPLEPTTLTGRWYLKTTRGCILSPKQSPAQWKRTDAKAKN